MPIPGICQPELLQIDAELRLRKFDDCFDFAFDWYQDEETVYLVDGVRRPYSRETLTNMYHYLDNHGELYFIEISENGVFRPIGDVTFSREDMPIVLGDRAYRGQGIGKKVVRALIRRGQELGYDTLGVSEIYHWNPASQRLFEHLGFRPVKKTERGARYEWKEEEICL